MHDDECVPEIHGGLILRTGAVSNSNRKLNSDEGGDETSEKGKEVSSNVT